MRIFIYIFICALIFGCNPRGDAVTNQNINVKNQARDALLAYADAINVGDVELAASFYDNDPDFHWIERGGVQYDNSEAAANSLKELIVPNASAMLTFDNVKVADLSVNAALVSAHFDYQMSFQGDQPSFSFDGWMSVAMVKRAEGWRIAAGQVGPGSSTYSMGTEAQRNQKSL